MCHTNLFDVCLQLFLLDSCKLKIFSDLLVLVAESYLLKFIISDFMHWNQLNAPPSINTLFEDLKIKSNFVNRVGFSIFVVEWVRLLCTVAACHWKRFCWNRRLVPFAGIQFMEDHAIACAMKSCNCDHLYVIHGTEVKNVQVFIWRIS